MKNIGFIVMLSVLSLNVWAQKESADVRSGNKLYKEKTNQINFI